MGPRNVQTGPTAGKAGPETLTLDQARARMVDAEDALRAIGAGEIDAFVVADGDRGQRVFTLSTADRPYRMFVENMREGAATISAAGLVVYANRRLAQLLSCSTESIVGSLLSTFVADPAALEMDTIRGAQRPGVAIELDLLDAHGARVPVLIGSSPLDVDGDALTCLTFTDVSAQRAQEREIARLGEAQADRLAELQNAQIALVQQATHDALTGLPNRELLVDRVEQALSRAKRSGGCVGVLFIDLDGFKRVNDSRGHAAGDALLRSVADTLIAGIRPMDTVARIGGDEFVVLAPEARSRTHAIEMGARLVAALADPTADREGCAASVGIAVSAGGSGTAETMLAEADRAMYEAKSHGGARAEIMGVRENEAQTSRSYGSEKRDSLERRLAQQSAVSALGTRGLRASGVSELLPEASEILLSGLGADIAAVYEHTAGGGAVLRAGAGELVAPPSANAADTSGRAFTLLRDADRPLLSADIRSEDRFDSPILQAQGMVSLVAAPIGNGADAFGFLGACSRAKTAFSEGDLAFVQSIANVLSATAERERVATRATEAESRIADLWDLSLDPLAVFSSDMTFLEVNQAWERTLGWTPAELLGKSALDFIHPDDVARTTATAEQADAVDGSLPEFVNRYRAKDESWRWLMWSVRQVPGGHIYAVAKDITERQTESERAQRREAQLNAAQRIGRMGSWETDVVSGRLMISETLGMMLGLDTPIVPLVDVLARVHSDDRAHVAGKFAERSVDPSPTSFRVVLPDGTVRVMASYAEPVLEDGRIVLVRGMVQDVTEQHARELALGRSEQRNRQAFVNSPVGMIMVDPVSKRFVRVNDAVCRFLGRSAEELSMLTVADVMHPDDVDDTPPGPRHPVGSETSMRAQEKRYIRPDGSVVWADLSISTGHDEEGSVDVIFGQLFDITERKEHEQAASAHLAEVAWLAEIQHAFEDDRFELHAQPIVEVATGATVVHELLIRMRGLDGRLIPPGKFLPAAESHGSIREIDRWVISRGAEIAAQGTGVTVNVSGVSLGDPGLAEHVETELLRTGADPRSMIIEITETALVEAGDLAIDTATRIRDHGCRFALDDFGTGYGGFHHLKTLPLDFLKIDQEFVRDALTSESDRHLIGSVVDIAKRFGLKTVAEGVEDEATFKLLARMDVDYAQGYHLGRPAPLAE